MALPIVQNNIAAEVKSVIVDEKPMPVEQKPAVVDDSKSVVAVEPAKVKKTIKKKPAVEILKVEKPKEQVNVQLH